MDITNKIVIITGGTGGIGFATVRALLKHGAKYIAILDLDAMKNRAAACIQKIDQEFGKGRTAFYKCDVTKPNEVAATFDEILKTQKTFDILINNAGMINDSQASRMIDVNVKEVINCTLAAIERLGKHNGGNGGTVLNVCSIVGLITIPAFPIYVATKHAVYGFTRALKENYESTGVRTLAICPGVTQTNFLEQDWRKDSLNFIPDKFIEDATKCSDSIQPPEHVAEAIIGMIQKAKSGDFWVSDANEPPYAIKDVPHYKERRI